MYKYVSIALPQTGRALTRGLVCCCATAVCGGDIPGDRHHVPRHHQRDDVPHGEPRTAHSGTTDPSGRLDSLSVSVRAGV